ncbi:MAG TPA: hypothetical protein VJ044_20745 [Candidatus Hodarchaeales archaeon]|nr:hypothetical protein [Candidatus Hodarchaeales archaeon]
MMFDEVKPEEREKIYIFGELEKLANDQNYYLRSKKKTMEFIGLNNSLLEKIKKLDGLEKKEIKTISKTKNWMKKLSRMIK